MQNETMIYGYARVSTAAQDESGQVKQLKAAGCRKIFREMKKLAPGDVVITSAVDRLSRDATDLLIIACEMQCAGAGIQSLAEPYLDTTSDFASRSSPSTSRERPASASEPARRSAGSPAPTTSVRARFLDLQSDE